jgi:uncharacterized membrane protein YccC
MDAARLSFGFRTALAAWLALYLAWLVGLEHPQWSAMTVWATSQPWRGHLIEKSAARLVGTVIGALFGLGLMIVSRGEPLSLVVGISLWIGLCALLGNLVRGYASYAAMLSGYSAAMVALLDSAHPEHVLALGLDRVLTVALGVAAALVVGWLFAAPGDDITIIEKVQLLTDRVLADIAARLKGQQVSEDEQRSVLTDLAAIEGALDLHGAGSQKARRVVQRIRALLAAQVTAILWLRSRADRDHYPVDDAAAPPRVASLERAEGENPARAVALARSAAGDLGSEIGLAPVLDALASASCQLNEVDGRPTTGVVLHRDWMIARRAMLRAIVSMLAVGAVCLLTGWAMGGFMMLGTAIMLSIFSTFENPAVALRHVLVGQLLGVSLALICRWLVWPFATGSSGLILAMLPFILIGAPISACRPTQRMAFDVNMVVLLMLQPSWPLSMSFDHSVMASLAVVAGPFVALVAFKLIYPVDSRRRYEAVKFSMIDDLEHLAASALRSRLRREWRALLNHRVLLAVYWGERCLYPAAGLAEDALAMLCVGDAIEHLGELALISSAPQVKRRIQAILQRLRHVGADPARAARALRAARSTIGSRLGGADILGEAAARLKERPAAFRKTQARVRFDFIINLKIASALGLKIPGSRSRWDR